MSQPRWIKSLVILRVIVSGPLPVALYEWPLGAVPTLTAGDAILLIPRVDDCTTLLLGSHQAYMREFEAVPGTYYLSKGWLESDYHPAREYEDYVEKYGPENAAMVMDMQYQHCERLVFVAHSQADLDKYRPHAQEVARYCERWGMRYEEILGSDAYVRRLIEVAMAPDKAGEDFLVTPPVA